MSKYTQAPALADPNAVAQTQNVDYLSSTSGTDLFRSPAFFNDLRQNYESKGIRFLSD